MRNDAFLQLQQLHIPASPLSYPLNTKQSLNTHTYHTGNLFENKMTLLAISPLTRVLVLLSSFLLFISSALAQNVNISASDPRVVWIGRHSVEPDGSVS